MLAVIKTVQILIRRSYPNWANLPLVHHPMNTCTAGMETDSTHQSQGASQHQSQVATMQNQGANSFPHSSQHQNQVATMQSTSVMQQVQVAMHPMAVPGHIPLATVPEESREDVNSPSRETT